MFPVLPLHKWITLSHRGCRQACFYSCCKASWDDVRWWYKCWLVAEAKTVYYWKKMLEFQPISTKWEKNHVPFRILRSQSQSYRSCWLTKSPNAQGVSVWESANIQNKNKAFLFTLSSAFSKSIRQLRTDRNKQNKSFSTLAIFKGVKTTKMNNIVVSINHGKHHYYYLSYYRLVMGKNLQFNQYSFSIYILYQLFINNLN